MFNNGNANFTMPVAPAYGGYGNGGFGGGFLGGDGIWALLIFAMIFGGYGNGNGFFGGGFGGNDGVLPYMWNTQTQNDVNRGFDNAGIAGQLSGIQSSISNGFATAEISDCGRAMDAMQTAYSNQIASMNQRFADVTALGNRLDDVSMALQNCCCENRANIADLKYTVATENCADRSALSDGVRDIIANQTANTQKILDKMCQDKIDAKNDEIVALQNQLNMATLRESQTAQNAFIAQGLSNEVDALYTRLSNCPVPTTPVYGRTPIFTCNNGGCGCACGA